MRTRCLLIVALALGLVVTGVNAETPKTVLKVITNTDNSTQDGQDWRAFVDQFEAKNPDVDVQDTTAYGEAYHQKARSLLAARDFPHIAFIWPDARGVYFKEAGQLVDNRPFMDKAVFDYSVIPPMGPNGEVWEVPSGASNFTSVLFCNTALLKKYGLKEPETYADLVAMVKPLKDAGIMVISMDGSEGWVWNSCLMSGLIPRFTGDPAWISKAVAGKYHFTDANFLKALSFIKTMVDDGVLPQSSMVTDYGTALTNFLNGKAAFMLDGQWRANGIEDPALQKNVKMLPFPQVPGEGKAMARSVSAAITSGYGITKAATQDPKVLDAAKRFIRAFYSEDLVAQRWKNGTIVAPTILMKEPVDLPPIALEKTRFAKSIVTLTDVLDSFLKPSANDALNLGMQKIALGKATAAEVGADVEKLSRAK